METEQNISKETFSFEFEDSVTYEILPYETANQQEFIEIPLVMEEPATNEHDNNLNVNMNDKITENSNTESIIENLGCLSNQLNKFGSAIEEVKPEFKLNIMIMHQQIKIMSDYFSSNDHSSEAKFIDLNNQSQPSNEATSIGLSDQSQSPTEELVLEPNPKQKKSIQDILKRPTPPKRIGNRRLKLKTYGVLSAQEAIDKIEEEKRKKEEDLEKKRKAKEEKTAEKEAKKAKQAELRSQIRELQGKIKVINADKTNKAQKSLKRKINSDEEDVAISKHSKTA